MSIRMLLAVALMPVLIVLAFYAGLDVERSSHEAELSLDRAMLALEGPQPDMDTLHNEIRSLLDSDGCKFVETGEPVSIGDGLFCVRVKYRPSYGDAEVLFDTLFVVDSNSNIRCGTHVNKVMVSF